MKIKLEDEYTILPIKEISSGTVVLFDDAYYIVCYISPFIDSSPRQSTVPIVNLTTGELTYVLKDKEMLIIDDATLVKGEQLCLQM